MMEFETVIRHLEVCYIDLKIWETEEKVLSIFVISTAASRRFTNMF